MAEFILEDGKLVTDGIPSERMPCDMNSNCLQVATDEIVKCSHLPKHLPILPQSVEIVLYSLAFSTASFPADTAKSVLFKMSVLRRSNINVRVT